MFWEQMVTVIVSFYEIRIKRKEVAIILPVRQRFEY